MKHMKQQRKYREPKDTVWGKCLSGFIAIVFAVSTLTIIPIASAALGSSTDSELMQEAEKEKKEKSSGQEDSAKVIEKAEITTLALENEKDEQPAETKSTITGYRASLSQTEVTYDGDTHKPTVTVTKDGNPLIESKDYTVDYQMGEGARAYTDADKYNIRVNLADGTEVANLEFCINPRPLTIKTGSAKVAYPNVATSDDAEVIGLIAQDEGSISVKTTGRQEGIGSSPNYYELTYKSYGSENYAERNYTVTSKELGTLTVYCEHEDWAENDGRWVYEDVATATCTKPGAYTKSCPVCKTIISKTETPAHGHSFEKVEWIFADDAQHKKVCEWCSGEEKGGVEYAAHDFTGWNVVTEATIDSEGLESRSCVDCGYVQERPIPMLPSCPVYWFDGYTSQVLQEGKVLKGDTADDTEDNAKALANPANPSRAGYEFLGWGLPVYDKDSVTITATWRLLTARWIDEDGTELAKADFKLSDDGLSILATIPLIPPARAIASPAGASAHTTRPVTSPSPPSG